MNTYHEKTTSHDLIRTTATNVSPPTFSVRVRVRLRRQIPSHQRGPKHPGGSRFHSEIGNRYTRQIIKAINFVVYDVFQQYSWSERKNVELIKLIIGEYEYDGAEAVTYGEEIYVNPTYLAEHEGDLRWDFTALIHHEMVHVFQWDGEGKAPVNLVEGVAEYVKLKLSYNHEGFAARGQEERWDQGYDVTARFLEYCDQMRPGFVAMLNRRMRYDYSDSYFEDLTGKPVVELWDEYKAKYQ